MPELSDNYDVIVVGGGPAGASAAIRLSAQGARVLLAEQKRFPRAKLCGEFISPECFDHFESLGVGDCMRESGGAELTETIFYSRSGASVGVPAEWFGAGSQQTALGLSRAEMDARLLERARASGVEVMEETRASGLLTEGEKVCGVRLKRGGREIEARALVTIDATGRARALARRMEKSTMGRRERRAANLVAFKAHLEGARATDGHCEIYFYRGGYGGVSQVEGGLSNLCFIAQARDVRARAGEAERVMREVLMKNARAARTLATARVVSPWLAVALDGFGRASVVPASGLLAAGDAASFIDPFTGSGMLMALESGELAARSIVRHLPSLRRSSGGALDAVSHDYRSGYGEAFSARLRMCAMMRRAAFIPRLAETLIFMLGLSERARRRLSRSTRL